MLITPQTKLCAVIGKTLEHSLSPLIHNAAIEYHKLNAVYLAFPVIEAKSALDAMKTLGILAFSVTIPYKEAVIPYLDKVKKQAQEVNNVNTIINRSGNLVGYNTDIDGVYASLGRINLKNKDVVVLGAGGAAKTVLYVANQKGARLHIFNRDLKQVETLAEIYKASMGRLEEVDAYIQNIHPYLLINATPVGMRGKLYKTSLVKKNTLKYVKVVFDVIYNPAQTKLLQYAKECGCKAINGRVMFLAQGARQFELWSGKKAPFRIMQRVFDNYLLHC